jgi:hypothetical protein
MRGLLGASALAILVPPNAFPGAATLDWIGLAVAVALAGFDFMRSRNGRRAAVQEAVKP